MLILYIDSVMPEGEYKGWLIEEILCNHPEYLCWVQVNHNKICISDEVMTMINSIDQIYEHVEKYKKIPGEKLPKSARA